MCYQKDLFEQINTVNNQHRVNVTIALLTPNPTSCWIRDKIVRLSKHTGKYEGAQRCEKSKRDIEQESKDFTTHRNVNLIEDKWVKLCERGC